MSGWKHSAGPALHSRRRMRLRSVSGPASASRAREGKSAVLAADGEAPVRRVAAPARQEVEPERAPLAIGEYDRGLSRDRLLDEIDREVPARAASEARAEPVGDPLRECGRTLRPRLESELGGCLDELSIGHAIAQADVHGPGRFEGQGWSVNGNYSDSQQKFSEISGPVRPDGRLLATRAGGGPLPWSSVAASAPCRTPPRVLSRSSCRPPRLGCFAKPRAFIEVGGDPENYRERVSFPIMEFMVHVVKKR